MDDAQLKERARHRAARARFVSFGSLEQENEYERHRRSAASVEDRLAEVKAIEDRLWGPGWEMRPMERTWSFEMVDWYRE